MFRGNRRFEVKREMTDAGSIRPDDNNNTNNYMTSELLEELGQVGFDDDSEFEVEQEEIEITLDENGSPILPEGWTFLTHGSSLDRWDTSLLGNDFVVGEGMVNGQSIPRPLCCVERKDAQFNYERRGNTTAQSYGGKNQAFEIRVLYYDNPRTSYGKVVREKLSPEQIAEVTKCYMYQNGRHPAIPAGTKLSFLMNGDFDEITNTNGNNILWYIPEQYLEAYLEAVQQTQNVIKDDLSFSQEVSAEKQAEVEPTKVLTNEDVEKELKEYYTGDESITVIEEYLVQKIQEVYGDKLQSAGIVDVRKFLDGKLEYFEGASSYREIIEELEDLIEGSEIYKKAFDELDIYHSDDEQLHLEKDEEFSPLLQGITGCKSSSEYALAKEQSSRVWEQTKGGRLPDKGDKGKDR